MRVLILAAAASIIIPVHSMAAAPMSVVALLGPSLGGLLGQNDLCGWNLASKIETTYRRSFNEIGLTNAQATTVWAMAHDRQAKMAKIPSDGQARMKGEMCTAEARQKVDQDLSH